MVVLQKFLGISVLMFVNCNVKHAVVDLELKAALLITELYAQERD